MEDLRTKEEILDNIYALNIRLNGRNDKLNIIEDSIEYLLDYERKLIGLIEFNENNNVPSDTLESLYSNAHIEQTQKVIETKTLLTDLDDMIKVRSFDMTDFILDHHSTKIDELLSSVHLMVSSSSASSWDKKGEVLHDLNEIFKHLEVVRFYKK